MSVVGFDVGNSASCVAVARKRGIDVLMNKESKRETPNVVHFGEKMRALGTVAAGKLSMYPKTTVTQIKRLLGKRFDDPSVQADVARFPFSVTEGPDGGCLVNVTFANQPASFTPEQILAMTFIDLKSIVAEDGGVGVTDCVASVPSYYTEKERCGMRDAANIAGLNVLRLMNDNTATALAYGIFKTDLPEAEPTFVAFVDVGDTSLQVSIVALKKAQLKMLSSAWDRDLGGRDFTEVLFEHFAKEFKEKTKLDVKQNPKGCFRLRTGCEKCKKILSANMEAMVNVECLMEDTDFSSRINREDFEGLCTGLLSRVAGPCEQAVAAAGIPIDQISSVEVVGSGARVPAVQKIIEDIFKKPASRTLNSKECISRGCALQCAMLSPIFKVRDFEVIDYQPYGVSFQWEKDNQIKDTLLFEKGCPSPVTKLLTFTRNAPFVITSRYVDDPLLLATASQDIGTYKVGKFKVPKGADNAKLKVKVSMDINGLVKIESVQIHEDEEYEVEEEFKTDAKASSKSDPPPEGEGAKGGGEDETNGQNPGEPGEEPSSVNGGEEKTEQAQKGSKSAKSATKTVKKKRTKKTDVPLEILPSVGLSTKNLNDYFELEGKMGAADRLQEETNDRKNALEEYILSIRHKINDELSAYVKEETRIDFSKKLDAMEDWLYDEGEDQTKSVYVGKLEELRKVGDPIVRRKEEDGTRTPAAQELGDLCSCFKAMASSDAKEYAHISKADKDKVLKECDDAMAWLQEKLSLQSQLQKYDEPALFTQDIIKKRDLVDRVSKPIMEQPPPAPTPPPAPATDPKVDEKSEGADAPAGGKMDVDAEDGNAEAGTPASGGKGDKMEID